MTEKISQYIAVEPDDLRFAALQRLQASRAHLQAALIPRRRPPAGAGAAGGTNTEWSATARSAWNFIRSRDASGLFKTLSGFLGQWWNGHPWQPTLTLLGETLDAEVTPWVRRHPASAIALGVGAGAAIAWIRPWRWSAVHGQARSLQRSASHWLMHELTSPAMQMVIATSVAAWLGQRNAPPTTEARAASVPSTAAAPDA